MTRWLICKVAGHRPGDVQDSGVEPEPLQEAGLLVFVDAVVDIGRRDAEQWGHARHADTRIIGHWVEVRIAGDRPCNCFYRLVELPLVDALPLDQVQEVVGLDDVPEWRLGTSRTSDFVYPAPPPRA